MPILTSADAFFIVNFQDLTNMDDATKKRNLKALFKDIFSIAAHRLQSLDSILILRMLSQLLEKSSNLKHILCTCMNLNFAMQPDSSFTLYETISKRIKLNSKRNKTKTNCIFLSDDNDNYLYLAYSSSCFSVFVSGFHLSYAVISITRDLDTEVDTLLFISLSLSAAGYRVVVVVSPNVASHSIDPLIEPPGKNERYIQKGKTKIFSEIHLFQHGNNHHSIEKLAKNKKQYSYVYISCNEKQYSDKIVGTQGTNPYLHIFHFNSELKNLFQQKATEYRVEELEFPFPRPKDQELSIFIPITGFNFQSFSHKSLSQWCPDDIIESQQLYIDTKDFMIWYGQRIKAYSKPESTSKSFYLDFNEMHHQIINLSITEPLHMTSLKTDKISRIKYIQKHLTESTKTFRGRQLWKGGVDIKNIEKCLTQVFHKIYKHWDEEPNKNIEAFSSQILAVDDAFEFVAENSETADRLYNSFMKLYHKRSLSPTRLFTKLLETIEKDCNKLNHDVTENFVNDESVQQEMEKEAIIKREMLTELSAQVSIILTMNKKQFLKNSQSMFLSNNNLNHPIETLQYLIDFLKKCNSKEERWNPFSFKRKESKNQVNEESKNQVSEERNTQVNKERNTHKGCIFQVKTGEGKSIIVAALAALLAKSGKTVHIVTSNISLASRDYQQSFNFFNKYGIRSAILIHRKDFDSLKTSSKEAQWKKFYSDKDFNNPSEMNISVMGNACKVVFSTFFNLEAWYLRRAEFRQNETHNYLRKCFLIIDESDTILLDELVNGTILSREIKTNATNILKLAYDLFQKRYEDEMIEKIVMQFWPRCSLIYLYKGELIKDIIIPEKPSSETGKYQYTIELNTGIQMMTETNKQSTKISKLKETFDQQKKRKEKMLSKAWIGTLGNFTKIELSEKEDEKKNTKKMLFTITLPNGSTVEQSIDYNQYHELISLYYLQCSSLTNKYILNALQTTFIGCSDMKEYDVESMYQDFKQAKKFQNGKDYVIENNNIVVFDSQHKGVIERNKEFNGFVHQFIGIKEDLQKKDNTDAIHIKPISFNYAYISHPMYVKLYYGVWGFTGTIGSDDDVNILEQFYKLKTLRIPRHKGSRKKKLNPIFTDDIEERDDRIVEEISYFHKQGRTVLVIFDDIKQIDQVSNKIKPILSKNDIKVINGFNIDIKDTCNIKEGQVILGSNVCGRGMSIQYSDEKPLHVIVSFGPKNFRSLKQAIGRTGRNGKRGTARIICTKKDYQTMTQPQVIKAFIDCLNRFKYKNAFQSELIDYYSQTNNNWIFTSIGIEMEPKITEEQKLMLNDTFFNVNRWNAVNYKFPICVKPETFIDIQIQRIFSLKNCPECKYSWMLFQRYMRELLFGTVFNFLNQVDNQFDYDVKKNRKSNEFENYKALFVEEKAKVLRKLKEIIPEKTGMVETFMQIHNYTRKVWGPILEELAPKQWQCMKEIISGKLWGKFGIMPFDFRHISGKQFAETDNANEYRFATNNYDGKTFLLDTVNFNGDPEMKFSIRNSPFDPKWSITHGIDKIANAINNLINFLPIWKIHFYLKRGLGGCEIGIFCPYPFKKTKAPPNCVFDLNLKLLISICCKSDKPYFASVLLFVLVFLTIIIKNIVSAFVPGENIIKGVKIIGQAVGEFIVEKGLVPQITPYIPHIVLLEKMITKLSDFIYQLIGDETDTQFKVLIVLLTMSSGAEFEDLEDKLSKNPKFADKKMNFKGSKLMSLFSPNQLLTRLGFCIIVLICVLIIKFIKFIRKKIGNDSNSDSETSETEISQTSDTEAVPELSNSDSAFKDSENEMNILNLEISEQYENELKEHENDNIESFSSYSKVSRKSCRALRSFSLPTIGEMNDDDSSKFLKFLLEDQNYTKFKTESDRCRKLKQRFETETGIDIPLDCVEQIFKSCDKMYADLSEMQKNKNDVLQ